MQFFSKEPLIQRSPRDLPIEAAYDQERNSIPQISKVNTTAPPDPKIEIVDVLDLESSQYNSNAKPAKESNQYNLHAKPAKII
jgi:hypothetical protein